MSYQQNFSRAQWVEQAKYWHREWMRARTEQAYLECRETCMANARLTDK